MASSDEDSRVLLEPDKNLLKNIPVVLNSYVQELIFTFMPDKECIAARRTVRRTIEQAVQESLGRYPKVELFGSCAIGIDTKESDLDVIVMCQNCKLSELKKLSKCLRRNRYGGTVKNVFNARIPIIQFTHNHTRVECDIKLGQLDPNIKEPPIHRLKSNFIKCIITADDRIRQLIVVIKKWAKARELNDASKGTLNSFGFTFLVIFFAQRLPKPLAPILDCVNYDEWFQQPTMYKDFGLSNEMSIGELLVTFFDFYQQFPFDELAVCVREKEFIEVSSLEVHEKQRRSMIIQDPFDEKDNVARNIKDMILKMFQKEFTRAVDILISSSPEQLFEPPVKIPTKNQLINKYIRTQKRKGVSKKQFDMKEAKKVLKVSEKRIQKAVDKIYYNRKKRRKNGINKR